MCGWSFPSMPVGIVVFAPWVKAMYSLLPCLWETCGTHMGACWASLKSFFFNFRVFFYLSSSLLFLCKSSQAHHTGLVSDWFGSLANFKGHNHCFPTEARSSTLDSKRTKFWSQKTWTTVYKKLKMFWLAFSFHFHNPGIHLEPPCVCIGSTAIS